MIMKPPLTTKYSRMQSKDRWDWSSLWTDYNKYELPRDAPEQENEQDFVLSGDGLLWR